MPALPRRSFPAAPAASAAAPASGAGPIRGEVDIVVVGAGAAGIAAARRIAAANRRVALLEATERTGGPRLPATPPLPGACQFRAPPSPTPPPQPGATRAAHTGRE